MENWSKILNLTSPTTNDDWNNYHNLSETMIFINIPNVVYDRNHPCFTSKNHSHFVIKIEDKIIGMFQLEKLKNHEWALRILAVDSSWQRKKIGTYIINFVKKFCKNQNGVKIRTHADNKSVGFYLKNGFHVEAWLDASINEGALDLAVALLPE